MARVRTKERYANDPAFRELLIARSRAYSQAHRLERNAYRREYYKLNRKRIQQQNKNSMDRRGGSESRREYQARHYRDNRGEIRERVRRYRKAHPEKAAEDYRKARAKPGAKDAANARARTHRAFKESSGGKHSGDDIKKLFHKQGGNCATCRAKLTVRAGPRQKHVDHILPLALGGSNYISNLQILCRTCNLRKNAKHPDDWAKENGLLFI